MGICALKDGKRLSVNYEDIFDSSRYHTISIITYSTSPKFILKNIEKFQKVNLIIGLEENNFLDNIGKIFDAEERIEFWKDLDIKTKEKIKDGQVNIKYGKKGVLIHSKIYILEGENEARVIMGSANFSTAAFTNPKQYEEIYIFDDKENFNIYRERFKEIEDQSSDYIPQNLKKIMDPIDIISNEETIIKETMIAILSNEGEGTEFIREELEELDIELKKAKLRINELATIQERINKTTRLNSKEGKRTMYKNVKEKVQSIDIKSSKSKKKDFLDRRPELIYNKMNNQIYLKKDEDAYIYSREGNNMQIKKSIQNIHKFCEAHKEFSQDNSGDPGKVLEAILYSFISPFIWKFKEEYSNQKNSTASKARIPSFMILGGRADSGKSTILEFLCRLTGSDRNSYYGYENIFKDIDTLFKTEKVYPIFIDEMPQAFFKSSATDLGERLIKSIANDLNQVHPTMIGVTNLNEFNVKPELLKRIYYVEVNNIFDKHRMDSASDVLKDIFLETDDTLFKDFLYRASLIMNTTEDFSYLFSDFLKMAREIFVEYYRISGIVIPKYFPQGKFIDFQNRGRDFWHTYYRSYSEAFIENYRKDINKKTLIIDLKKLGIVNEKDISMAKNYLDSTCIINEAGMLEVKKDKFLKWINVESLDKVDFISKIKKLFNVNL